MTTDPLLQRLGQMAWPTPMLDEPDPEPGQVWRATCGAVASLVAILEAPTGRTTLVAAATPDQVGDDRTVPIATEQGFTPAVWGGVTSRIKTFCLECRLADMTEGSLSSVLAAVSGATPSHWAPITSDLDDRTLIRADLVDRLGALADADWVPDAESSETSLADLVAESGTPVSSIAQALGIAPGDARRLVQGRRVPTASEQDRLTELLGATPGTSAQYDEALVAELDRPPVRPALRVLANTDFDGDELAARRRVAEDLMAMAARHREPGERNWAALIQDRLRED